MCERDPRGSLEAGAGRARWKPRRRARPGRAGSGGNAQAPPGRGHGALSKCGRAGAPLPAQDAAAVSLRIGWQCARLCTAIGWGRLGVGRGRGPGGGCGRGRGGAAANQFESAARRDGARTGEEKVRDRSRDNRDNGGTPGPGTGTGANRGWGAAGRSGGAAERGGRCRRDGRGSEALGPRPCRAADGPAVPSEVLANEAVSCLNRAMAALRDIWEEIGIPEEQRLERTDVVRKHIKVRGAGSSVGPRTCCMQRPPATRAARREPTQRRCRGSSTGPGLRGAPGVPARLLPRLCPRPAQPRPAGLPTPRSGPARVPRGGPAALPALGSHAPPLTAPVCRASWT